MTICLVMHEENSTDTSVIGYFKEEENAKDYLDMNGFIASGINSDIYVKPELKSSNKVITLHKV